MDTGHTYTLASRDIVAEDFDGEFVVLDLRSGKYFSFAAGASLVWKALIAGHSFDTLTAALPAGDPRRAQVERVIAGLVAGEILVVADAAPAGPPDLATALAACSGDFAVDVFDDLSDLLVADPIHDVDPQAGWPHQPRKV